MRLRSLVVVVTAFLLLSAWTGTTRAQQRPTVPSERHSSVDSTAALPVESLPPVDGAALRRKAETERRNGPYRYGKALDTDFTPAGHGTWEQLPSGDWLWRLRIQSEDAVSLHLGFIPFELPNGAELYVRDPDLEVVHGPYVKEDATNGQLWTPIVEGSEIIVELEVPSDARSDLALTIRKVSHGFRSLGAAATQKATAKSRACHIDVTCPRADSWRDQVRSVGLYSFQRDGFSSVCSGSLVNNTEKDGTPYFLTAEHCLHGSESAAASMVFYWNYQNPTCRTPGSTESGTVTSDDKNDQTSSGALLQMSYGNCEDIYGSRCIPSDIDDKPDITLVKVDDTIPSEYNLFLNGWNRTDFAPSKAASIHHPQGHGKRISFEEDATSITGISTSNDDHIEVDWAAGDGTTEGGSSGGPLFSPSKKVVGVLSAGGSGCEITDWYGRVHKAWEGGGNKDTRLKDWLDPNGTGTKTLNGQSLSAPPPVSDFRIVQVTSNSATLRWTAPENDGSSSSPNEYDLRVRSTLPIETTGEFENARRVSDVPSPNPPGTTQEATVDLNPDTSYYFAIRTVDANKNASSFTASGNASPVTNLRITRKPGPNPTTGLLKFGFSVAERQSVRVDLYDTMGRRVRTLFDDDVQQFRQRTVTAQLSSLSSGIYFLRFRSNSTVRTEKIVVGASSPTN